MRITWITWPLRVQKLWIVKLRSTIWTTLVPVVYDKKFYKKTEIEFMLDKSIRSVKKGAKCVKKIY